MNYQEAEKIRGKGFASTMTDKILSGQGIGQSFKSTVSEKSKATMKGIKQKFDPMNLAKKLTGGSKLGPALLGRMTGRSQEDIEFFAGKGRGQGKGPGKVGQSAAVSGVAIDFATEILGEIYKLLQQIEQDRTLTEELKHNKEEEEQGELDKRNQEIIAAITGRKKKEPTRREEARKKKEEVKKKKTAKREEEKKKEPEKKPEPTKKEKPAAKEPAKKPEKAPPTAEKAPAPTTKPPTTVKVPPVALPGSKGLVLGALVAAGYSKQAQANVMANVEEESRFRPRSEELEKYSAKTLYKLYGPPGAEGGQPVGGKNKVRFQTMQEAQDVVNRGPEAVGDVIYGGRMGNDKPGDGYKYRGRGFIQITGKENYDKIGKMIGVDLVGNPDLANQPEIAAKIIPAYFKMKIKKPEDLENIDRVNAAVGSASEKSKMERKSLASSYTTELNSGNQINSSSRENQQLKKDLNAQQAQSGTQRQTTNIKTTSTPQQSVDVDDSSSYDKKRRSV